MKLIILLITIINLISCNTDKVVQKPKWICENKYDLITTDHKSDTVIIYLEKSKNDQLLSLNNQLNRNVCNQTNLLYGIINFSDSSQIVVNYKARPNCPNDTILKPIDCFPDPSIQIFLISDSVIYIDNRKINFNQLSENEIFFTFENWDMFKNKVFEFHWTDSVNISIKENVVKLLYIRHFEILDSIATINYNKPICELDSIELKKIKSENPIYFAQREIPTFIEPIIIESENIEIELNSIFEEKK